MLNEFFYGSTSTGSSPPGRSLRFNEGDSSYLKRTPSATGNRQEWTWSGWVKQVDILGTNNNHFFSTNDNDSWGFGNIGSNTDPQLRFSRSGIGHFGGNGQNNPGTALYRDTSAWRHIVVSCDTTKSDDRFMFYVNGELAFTSNCNYNQNSNTTINSTNTIFIGVNKLSNGKYASFYLAEINFIDGQVLDPTDFGQYDANNVWQMSEFTGTYGSQGFHLDFSDNSSVSALGTDSSGNGNDFTVHNLSVAAGAGNDSLVDSPTNGTQTDTGLGGEVSGNYCTLNPLDLRNGGTLSNGNLSASLTSTSTATSRDFALGTFATLTGKWYFEITIDSFSSSSRVFKTNVGIANVDALEKDPRYHSYKYGGNGVIKGPDNNTIVDGLTECSVGDVIGIAYDLDNQNFYAYLNGTANGSTSITAARYTPFVYNFDGQTRTGTYTANFGQRAFSYPLSGYKALCTSNLPTPAIADGSQYFDTKLWTGNSSTQTISGYGFSPDFAWIKVRSESARSHFLFDTIRGATNALKSDASDAEQAYSTSLTAFNSDGFDLGAWANVNNNSKTIVGWAWDAGDSTVSNTDGSITSQVRANPTAGVSICTYTGTEGGTFGHGLNAAPEFVMVKRRNTSAAWCLWHKAIPNTQYLMLDSTAGANTYNVWGNTSPTSSVVSVSGDSYTGNSGDTYVAYCMTPVEGYSVMSSYKGNGSTKGFYIHTGFKPRWILIKAASRTGSWLMYDTARSTYNTVGNILFADQTGTENSSATYNLDIFSNGFQPRGTTNQFNSNGETYLYVAFAEHPVSSNGGIAR
jgi:hypothetical protein